MEVKILKTIGMVEDMATKNRNTAVAIEILYLILSKNVCNVR